MVDAAQERRTLWVGNLAQHVGPQTVQSFFVDRRFATRVLTVRQAGDCGPQGYQYALVEFTSQEAAQEALLAFNGVVAPELCAGGRGLKINFHAAAGKGRGRGDEEEWEPTPTELAKATSSLWLGNLEGQPSPKDIWELFSPFGHVEIAYNPGKLYGFANYADRASAARAMKVLNGKHIPYITGSRPLLIEYHPQDRHTGKAAAAPPLNTAQLSYRTGQAAPPPPPPPPLLQTGKAAAALPSQPPSALYRPGGAATPPRQTGKAEPAPGQLPPPPRLAPAGVTQLDMLSPHPPAPHQQQPYAAADAGWEMKEAEAAAQRAQREAEAAAQRARREAEALLRYRQRQQQLDERLVVTEGRAPPAAGARAAEAGGARTALAVNMHGRTGGEVGANRVEHDRSNGDNGRSMSDGRAAAGPFAVGQVLVRVPPSPPRQGSQRDSAEPRPAAYGVSLQQAREASQQQQQQDQAAPHPRRDTGAAMVQAPPVARRVEVGSRLAHSARPGSAASSRSDLSAGSGHRAAGSTQGTTQGRGAQLSPLLPGGRKGVDDVVGDRVPSSLGAADTQKRPAATSSEVGEGGRSLAAGTAAHGRTPGRRAASATLDGAAATELPAGVANWAQAQAQGASVTLVAGMRDAAPPPSRTAAPAAVAAAASGGDGGEGRGAPSGPPGLDVGAVVPDVLGGPPVSNASLPDCHDRSAALAKLYACVLSVVGEDQRGWRLKRVAMLRLLCAGLDESARAGGAPAGVFVQRGVHVPKLGEELKELRDADPDLDNQYSQFGSASGGKLHALLLDIYPPGLVTLSEVRRGHWEALLHIDRLLATPAVTEKARGSNGGSCAAPTHQQQEQQQRSPLQPPRPSRLLRVSNLGPQATQKSLFQVAARYGWVYGCSLHSWEPAPWGQVLFREAGAARRMKEELDGRVVPALSRPLALCIEFVQEEGPVNPHEYNNNGGARLDPRNNAQAEAPQSPAALSAHSSGGPVPATPQVARELGSQQQQAAGHGQQAQQTRQAQQLAAEPAQQQQSPGRLNYVALPLPPKSPGRAQQAQQAGSMTHSPTERNGAAQGQEHTQQTPAPVLPTRVASAAESADAADGALEELSGPPVIAAAAAARAAPAEPLSAPSPCAGGEATPLVFGDFTDIEALSLHASSAELQRSGSVSDKPRPASGAASGADAVQPAGTAGLPARAEVAAALGAAAVVPAAGLAPTPAPPTPPQQDLLLTAPPSMPPSPLLPLPAPAPSHNTLAAVQSGPKAVISSDVAPTADFEKWGIPKPVTGDDLTSLNHMHQLLVAAAHDGTAGAVNSAVASRLPGGGAGLTAGPSVSSDGVGDRDGSGSSPLVLEAAEAEDAQQKGSSDELYHEQNAATTPNPKGLGTAPVSEFGSERALGTAVETLVIAESPAGRPAPGDSKGPLPEERSSPEAAAGVPADASGQPRSGTEWRAELVADVLEVSAAQDLAEAGCPQVVTKCVLPAASNKQPLSEAEAAAEAGSLGGASGPGASCGVGDSRQRQDLLNGGGQEYRQDQQINFGLGAAGSQAAEGLGRDQGSGEPGDRVEKKSGLPATVAAIVTVEGTETQAAAPVTPKCGPASVAEAAEAEEGDLTRDTEDSRSDVRGGSQETHHPTAVSDSGAASPPERQEASGMCQLPGTPCCATCGVPSTQVKLRRCSDCRAVRYCGKACQLEDWSLRHHADCCWLTHLSQLLAAAGSEEQRQASAEVLLTALEAPSGHLGRAVTTLLNAALGS